MPNKNEVTLEGHLGRDPVIRQVGSGYTLCSFSVAITRRWKSGDDWKSEVYWAECTAWNRQNHPLATLIAQNFKKGNAIGVTGYLRLEEWDDKNTGEKRSKTGVVVDHAWRPVYQKKEQAPDGGARQQNDEPRAPTGDEIPF